MIGIKFAIGALVIYWLMRPAKGAGLPDVSIGDDYSVDFRPRPGGAFSDWSDAYKAEPGDPP